MEEPLTTAEFIPADKAQPETFSVSAADHISRGRARGRELSEGIVQAIEGYRRFFDYLGISDAQVVSAAESSYQTLKDWDAEAAEEIDAIAQSAGIPVNNLMTVIARTEIMTQAASAPSECSTVSYSRRGSSLAAQNWDWAADFSTLWHFNEVGGVPGQLAHSGMAEYGMPGKIGLNEKGVGVLLNILKHDGDGPGGVPIHMVLERVLSRAHSLNEALALIHSALTSSSSVISVVTADEVVQVEIANSVKRERRAGDNGFLLHTNHFLHPDLVPGGREINERSTSADRCRFLEDSIGERFSDRSAANDSSVTMDDLTALLTSGPGEAPVCAAPAPDEVYGQRSATLVNVRIDPGAKAIDIAPGSPAQGLKGSRRFQL